MPLDAAAVRGLFEAELAQLRDPRVMAHIRGLEVPPAMTVREWYREPGSRFACWSVLADKSTNLGILYCAQGPFTENPWGLVSLHDEGGMSTGNCWYEALQDAYFDSVIVCDLPIWRVFKGQGRESMSPITPEDSWSRTWEQVYALRKSDPDSRYGCNHSIDWPGSHLRIT